MLNIQARAVDLLKEIDDICEANGIRYSLAGRTAAMQAASGGFTCSDYRPEIMMLPADYRKFCNAVAEKGAADRIIESLETNPDVDGIYARYVDISTTLIDTRRAAMLREQGVHVLIWVLRSKSPSSKYEKALDTIVRTNNIVSVKIKKEYRRGKSKAKFTGLEMTRKLLRRPGTMKKFFETATADDGKSKSLYYVDVADGGRKVKVARKYLNKYRRVDFEGTSVMVIDQVSDMLRKNYGDDFANAVTKPICPSGDWGVYYDLNHPFKQVISEAEATGTDFAKIAIQRADYDEFMNRVHNKLEFRARKQYRLVKRTINRFNLMDKYKGRADEIEAMYEAGNIDDVRDALADYIERIEFFTKRNLGFSFDNKLLHIAYEVMNKDGKADIVKKAKKLLPEEYKEDLADWLAAEGFERKTGK